MDAVKEDPVFCMRACFFPCVAAGENAELRAGPHGDPNAGDCDPYWRACACACGANLLSLAFCGNCCLAYFLATERDETIERRLIQPSNECEGCPLLCFCMPCALTQEHLQLLNVQPPSRSVMA